MSFKLQSSYKPRGDQEQAIAKLLKSVEGGNRHQTLLGVTGSGKTFTIANVIQNLNRPTLVISHNKTLAAQLYAEFKGFFPNNAVEYFVSYFDYYQPEAYIPRTDTFIEKDSSINSEIERLRRRQRLLHLRYRQQRGLRRDDRSDPRRPGDHTRSIPPQIDRSPIRTKR